MDAAWKVYVGDRRFDDNQISNLFLKLKYETVGRFTFDFRPIDGDESYMQNGRTLRIFWGDLHRLDGVIQRVDWDDTLYCYHVFGADIRGFLLDRVNTEPSTVSSYTSDVQTQVQYTGCDFPSNIWTGAGDKIGTYTFHYKLGIQNTIRITGATQNYWTTIVERGTVYDHVNGCLYDATKNWVANEFAGATLRFVSGACKNNVYNICTNASNRVCLRMATQSCSDFASDSDRYAEYGTQTFYNYAENGSFTDTLDPWDWYVSALGETVSVGATVECVDGTAYLNSGDRTGSLSSYTTIYCSPTETTVGAFPVIEVKYKHTRSIADDNTYTQMQVVSGAVTKSYTLSTFLWNGTTNPSYPDFDVATIGFSGSIASTATIRFQTINRYTGERTMQLWLDDFKLIASDTPSSAVQGTVPGCSRLGDIYEIVQPRMIQYVPASLPPATLQKDNHIIQYNQTDDLSDHITSVVVQGINELITPATYPEGWHWPWES